MIELTSQAEKALELLENSGFEAFVVGGFVRDCVMQRHCNDVDITTNAFPEEIKECFSSFKTIDTGIKHGTVTVLIDEIPIEITTYRSDGVYSDNRHPESISFCKSLKEDVSRRDFTINALAYSRKAGIVDYFGGVKDIENKTIRAIGDPEKRFREDALRILRAIRFSSVLGFEIEEKTKCAIHQLKNLICNISVERIAVEMKRLLCGKNVKNVMLEYFDVFQLVCPELSGMKGFDQRNFHHKFDIWEHTAVVVENAPSVDYLRLTALFHDCGKVDTFSLDKNGVGHFYSHASVSAEKAETALRRLKFDNFTVSRVKTLVKIHDTPLEESETYLKKRLSKLGYNVLKELISVQRADTLGLADEFHSRKEHFDCLEEMIEKIILQGQCFSIKDLAVDGNDLIEIGFRGKAIGEALAFLLEAVIGEKVENQKESLINYLKREE
ncbi:MAG: CCA tRNA nucleotidyltransferase [Clostridia bacterium]|nr:CCA tRNA nucleotidyltransferase [Clostridia bacterium]